MTDISKATPLAYRPLEYDDWGVIRRADGRLFARARSDAYLSVADADAHRAAGTDPYEAIGRLIVKAVNERDELIAAMREAQAVLSQLTAPDMKIGAGDIYFRARAAEVEARAVLARANDIRLNKKANP